MALPKLLQKLFTNGGAGDKLNKSIVPDLDYLPTSGGTVSGAVTFNGEITASELRRSAGHKELVISGANNDGCISLVPGTTGQFSAKKSASLLITSTDYTGPIIPAGSFYLSAMNATTGEKSLIGSPDGSLTWENQSVAIFQSVSPTSSLWYAKFNQGLILQGNNYHITHWGESTVTLPIAFQTTNYIISVTPYLKNVSSFTKAPEVCLLSQTTTSFTFYAVSGNVTPSNALDMYISYACIGY